MPRLIDGVSRSTVETVESFESEDIIGSFEGYIVTKNSCYFKVYDINAMKSTDGVVYEYPNATWCDLGKPVKKYKPFKNVKIPFVMYLQFEKVGRKRLYVDMFRVYKDYTGMGLSYKFYKFLMSLGYSIVSGKEQSPGGRFIWKQLAKDKDIEVVESSTDKFRFNKRKSVKAKNDNYMDEQDMYNTVFIAKLIA